MRTHAWTILLTRLQFNLRLAHIPVSRADTRWQGRSSSPGEEERGEEE
jgi:hypothetical protein